MRFGRWVGGGRREPGGRVAPEPSQRAVFP